MDSTHRRSYLGSLGLDSYISRWVLPLAATPIAIETPVDENQLAQPNPVLTDQPPPAASPKIQQNTDNPTQAPPKENPSTTQISSFALSVWSINQNLMVIDTRKAQLALPTDVLLYNILAAWKHLPSTPSKLPKAEILRWPLVNNTATDEQGESAAREMLQAYLDARLQSQPAKYLLLMGHTASYYILPKTESIDERINETWGDDTRPWPQLTYGEHITTAIVSHSLATLLQQPHLKAQLWKKIQLLT